MQKAYLMLLLLVGAIHAAAVIADETGPSIGDAHRPPVTAASIDSLRLMPWYSARWQLRRPVETTAFSNDAPAVITDIEFQDPGAFARVRKVRALSLLTLAEVGRTRLFLGVSERGLLGFHLGALPQLDDERCLELARMPYLKSDRSDDLAE